MPIAMPATMDVTATRPTAGRAACRCLAEGEVDPTVADILDRFDQRGLQQERRDDADDGASTAPSRRADRGATR